MEASGMEVTVAQNGKEAVDFFAASEKDYFDLNLTLICRNPDEKGRQVLVAIFAVSYYNIYSF